MKYVVLDDKKRPTEKLSYGGHDLAEVEEFGNLGVLVPEPFVVLDFDTTKDAEIILDIIEAENLACKVMKTTRGVHVWFTAPEPFKNSIKTKSAVGLIYDVRSYGKISYTVVKKDGEWRKWLKDLPDDEVQALPRWLYPVASKYDFPNMGEGDGRNNALFEYILVLQRKGFDRALASKTIELINSHVLESPVSESELKTILRDDAFVPEDKLKTAVDVSHCFTPDGGFKHNEFAGLLVDMQRILTVNGQIYMLTDGYYKPVQREVEKEMVRLYPTIRMAQRREVLDYISILTSKREDELPRAEYKINLQNGRLDVRTRELFAHDGDVPEFSQLPVKYDKNAYNPTLDAMLDKVFCNDQAVRKLFEEMVGYLLIKNTRFRKGFILYGSGANGKSTVLNLLKAFLGLDNISTVELRKLGDPFLTAELENKLANIGDDIDVSDIKHTGTIKKLFTGESMTVQRKYQQPFNMRSFAKLIFSCNELPRISDKSHGMHSRLMFIPFNAYFSPRDKTHDPFIEEKITKPEALSYLLNLGLNGVERLLQTNRFTEPDVVKTAMRAYKSNNSTVMMWLDEEVIDRDDLMSKSTEELFARFNDWCTRFNIKYPSSLRTFHRELADEFDFERVRVRNNTTGGVYKWFFVPKDEAPPEQEKVIEKAPEPMMGEVKVDGDTEMLLEALFERGF